MAWPFASVPSVSVSDAALSLGAGEQRVHAMISAGSIDAEKIAGAWLIPATSLARLAASYRQGGRPLSAANAWALLLLASGEPVGFIEGALVWRQRSMVTA